MGAIYGLIALLSVSILAALDLSSRYGLQEYVREQLGRIPWDITVVQTGEVYRFSALRDRYRAINRVRDSQVIGFLRVRLISPLTLEIDERPLNVRWLTIVSASKPELLPAEFRKTASPGLESASDLLSLHDMVVMLVGTQRDNPTQNQIEKIRPGSKLRLLVDRREPSHAEGSHDHSQGLRRDGPSARKLFEGRAAGAPLQIERQEFNKWMLQETGSMAYLPEQAVVIPVPLRVFEALAEEFHHLFLVAEQPHGGGGEPPPYVPQVTHLISVDRSAVVSPWDLSGSVRRLAPVAKEISQAAWWLTPFFSSSSDLQLLLTRMDNIGRLVGVATLLVGVPLLWLGWVLASTLSRLLVLNERRLMGLALIRGIPMRDLKRSLLLALLIGGAAGGLMGLALGTGVPVIGYYLAGSPSPPAEFFIRNIFYFLLFLGVGLLLALLSGRSVLKYVQRLTPLEAVARTQAEEEALLPNISWYYACAFLVALLVGSYKVISWVIGYSPLLTALRAILPVTMLGSFSLVESLLNFVAVPFFLYGLAGLLSWRAVWIQKGLSALAVPLVGRLHWFVSEHMALRRHRVAGLLSVAGLAASLSLMPQVAADTFYGRVLRGVRTSLGADLLLEIDMASLAGGDSARNTVSHYQQKLQQQLSLIRSLLERQQQVAAVGVLQQFFVPGVYIPGQSGLVLNLLEDPDRYLELTYHEGSLGITRDFTDIVRSLDEGKLAASQGLLRVRAMPLGKEITLGSASEGKPMRVRFTDAVAFLPGQPALGVHQREGFVAAEVDYLNYLWRSDARIIAAAPNSNHSTLENLQVLPSRLVFLVKTKEGTDIAGLAQTLNATLPIRSAEMRWEASERKRISRDMFISLSLENMKVYMAGGLVLALVGVAATALANWLADRRTYSLLRLRGVSLLVLLRISLSIFLIPLTSGVVIGVLLGTTAGYGVSQLIWDLPRIYGVGGFLPNHLVFSGVAVAIVILLVCIFAFIAAVFGFWIFRRTARETMRES